MYDLHVPVRKDGGDSMICMQDMNMPLSYEYVERADFCIGRMHLGYSFGPQYDAWWQKYSWSVRCEFVCSWCTLPFRSIFVLEKRM